MNTQATHVSTDDGRIDRYFHVMYNLYDDDLDPFEYRLIGHYRRVGVCTQSTRTIAAITRMAVGTVSAARKRLVKKGLIHIEMMSRKQLVEMGLPAPARMAVGCAKICVVRVVDVMKENVERYQSDAGSQGPVVHVVNNGDSKSLPHCSCGGDKENKDIDSTDHQESITHKKESTPRKRVERIPRAQPKPKTERPRDEIYDAITRHIYRGIEQPFFVGTLAAWMKGGKESVKQNGRECQVPAIPSPATPQEIENFPTWLRQNYPNIEVKQPTVVVDYYMRYRTRKTAGSVLDGIKIL